MKENTNALEAMDKLPVSKAVIKNVLPAVLIMLMSLIYNMADKVFIGMANNDYMVAAVTLAMPVFILFTSFGNIFGTGGVALISQYTGSGQKNKAEKVASFCFWGSLGIGVILMIILMALKSPIVNLLGATGNETIAYTKDYLTYIAICCPFAIISQTISSLVRADGKPVLSMAGMIIGNVVNIVLDPILILWLNMGTSGAALATLIGQVSATTFYVVCIIMKKCSISINIKHFSMKEKIAVSVFAIGIPAALGSIFQSVCNILTNNQIIAYGDIAVAGMGAAQNIITIISIFAVGIGMGIQPLLGYQIGNKNKKKFKEIMGYSIKMTCIITLALTLLCYLFTTQITGLFVSGEEAVVIGANLSRITMSTAWIYAIFTVLSLSLQAMGCSTESLVANMSRNCYVFIPIMFAMSKIGGMYGIVWALPVSDLICIIITILIMKKSVNKIFAEVEDDTNKSKKVLQNNNIGIEK